MKQIPIIFILIFLLAACSNEIKPKEHAGEIYSVALDNIMEKDEALSEDIEFIAIEMNEMDELTELDKMEILSYFKEKYKIDVMYATLEQLKEKGLYNTDTMVLDGVLLRIVNIAFEVNDVLFEGSKYRAGDGAVGVKGVVHFKGGNWKIKESQETWIS